MSKIQIPNIKIEDAVKDIKQIGFENWLLATLMVAFLDARKGKLKTHDEHKFEVNYIENLVKLRDAIISKTYEPGSSVSFVVFEPMVREIFAAPFMDRVVHHFLFTLQGKWWDDRLINDSYSCRVGKGTLFAAKRMQKMMRQATAGGSKKAYIIKLDISGYFMSLPRKKIYGRIRWGLDQQFTKYKNNPAGYQLYRTCDFLWRKVLFDDPVKKAHKRGPLENWAPSTLPPKKSLYNQPYGYGIVIGNLTSQLTSNTYLDELDRFVKFKLKYKYYGRYVDDFFIIVDEDHYKKAKQDIAKIEKFLKDELELTLHKKKRHFVNVEKGVEFVGYRIYPNAILPSDRMQKHFKKAVMDVAYGYKDIESIISYLGLMKHMNAKKFLTNVFDDMGWDAEA